eukprot:6455491-Amphidinium_carterae.1
MWQQQLPSNVLTVHVYCAMHQASLAVTTAFTPMRQLPCLFCGCNLLRRGTWMSRLDDVVGSISSTLEVLPAFEVVADESQAKFLAGLLDLLSWYEPETQLDQHLRARQTQRRSEKRGELATFLHITKEGRLQHRCKIGCAASHPKMRKTVGVKLNNMLSSLWMRIYQLTHETQQADDLWVSPLEPTAQDVEQKLNVARAKKVSEWLKLPHTGDALVVACIVLRPCMSLMGYIFRSEASAAQPALSELLCEQNPVDTVVHLLLTKLTDLRSDFWCCLGQHKRTNNISTPISCVVAIELIST